MKISERIGHLADLMVVKEAVEDRIKEQRNELHGDLEAVEAQTGAAPTARVAGVGSSLLTSPQPKVSVVDRNALASDLLASGIEELAALVVVKATVDISPMDLDDLRASAVDEGVTDAEFRLAFLEALDVGLRYVLSENVAEQIADYVVVEDGHVIWAQGNREQERVEGVSVKVASRALQVRLEKSHKMERRLELERSLSSALRGTLGTTSTDTPTLTQENDR